MRAREESAAATKQSGSEALRILIEAVRNDLIGGLGDEALAKIEAHREEERKSVDRSRPVNLPGPVVYERMQVRFNAMIHEYGGPPACMVYFMRQMNGSYSLQVAGHRAAIQQLSSMLDDVKQNFPPPPSPIILPGK